LDLDKLVFFDESGVNTLMARLRGRCAKGERLVDSAPAGRYETLTLTSAVRLEGVVAPMLLDGPVNAETFAGYVEDCLLPALEPGDVLIMDKPACPQGGADHPGGRGCRVHARVPASVFAGLESD
jgi:hypothetical protein